MSRRRPALTPCVALAICLIAAAAPADASSKGGRPLDTRIATRAVDAVRHCLPHGWKTEQIRWDTVPDGWHGDADCVLIHVRDTSMTLSHSEGKFRYSPYYKVWLLPPCWEGRMEVSAFDPEAEQALYLGESEDFRVLYRTRGVNSWFDGPQELGDALGLEIYPLTHEPEHTLDVTAMQRLFQRLDAATGGDLDRWTRQIYGIEELSHLIYVELLTWEDRGDAGDPTFLGDLAELETQFLCREALRAFPKKRGLYLRRVTRASFSDVIVVNPSEPGS